MNPPNPLTRRRPPILLPCQTPRSAAEYLLCRIEAEPKTDRLCGRMIVTLNLEMLARARRSGRFALLLHTADGSVCDGVGAQLLLAGHHPNGRVPRIPGIDLGREVISCAAKRGRSVFLLGGKAGVAEKAARHLRDAFPALQIAGCAQGYFSPNELPALRGKIHASGASIVIVCLGSPLQEEWIAANRRYLPRAALFLPLGGALDVWAGEVRRAPRLLRTCGLEWLWRISSSPRRIARLSRACFGLLCPPRSGNIGNIVSN